MAHALTERQNDPNGMFLDANGTYHLYYQCKRRPRLRA